MTDTAQIARESWNKINDTEPIDSEKVIQIIEASLREYGEAEVKADRQRMHREPSMERIKEADTAGYRRGVEEAAKESDIMREPMISWHIRRLLQRGTGGSSVPSGGGE